MEQVHANYSASITELKRNPSALLHDSNGEPIAILNHNKPQAYLIPAEAYAVMLEILEDAELSVLVKERLKEKDQAVSVSLDDL